VVNLDLPGAATDSPSSGESVSDAIEALYRDHHAFVWRNARRLGCDNDWVDDAVHEIFLVAARRLREFEGRSSVRTWLFAIAVRVIRRMRRGRKRYDSKLAEWSSAHDNDRAESPEGQSESARYLRSLLARLDEPRRIVVILIELEGMTSFEVAAATGTKQGTVDSRLRSARQSLAKMIERDRLIFERQMR
jgi:RNA polymerase sigma-70 factor (ECF subfamily)